MAPEPEIPSTEDADPDVQSTPGGLTQELEDEIHEHGGEVAGDDDTDDPDSDGDADSDGGGA